MVHQSPGLWEAADKFNWLAILHLNLEAAEVAGGSQSPSYIIFL
jgi:hypothetical protein